MTPPIDRFNSYVKEHGMELLGIYAPLYTELVVRQEFSRMRVWLSTAPPNKANKRNWGRFIRNWFAHCDAEKERVIVNMNARQEDLYYATKQRPTGRRGDFKQIDLDP